MREAYAIFAFLYCSFKVSYSSWDIILRAISSGIFIDSG
nr:MAG TPA: hypothetical protein [Caudoviricetes sp.]